MATIIINRADEYVNRLRNYQLVLDGKKIGTVSNGQTLQFETTAGTHTFIAKIDWCSSPELSFTLEPDEEITFTIGGFKNARWIMPVAAGIIALHFLLKTAFDLQVTIVLIIPAFLLLLYYITAGRKNYLSVKQSGPFSIPSTAGL